MLEDDPREERAPAAPRDRSGRGAGDRRLGPAWGFVLAGALWAVVNLAVWVAHPPAAATAAAAGRMVARTAAVGILLGLGCAVLSRVPLRPPWRRLVVAAAFIALGAVVLPGDLSGRMHDQVPAAPVLATWAGVVVIGLSPPAALFVLERRPAWWLRIPAVAAAVLAWVANVFVLENSYLGAHLFLGLMGLALVAGALAPLPRRAMGPRGRLARRAGGLMLAALALAALVVPASDTARLALLSFPGDVLTPYLSQRKARPASAEVPPQAVEPPEVWRPWFRRRDDAPAVAPTATDVRPPAPIVVLLTIDSLRADVLSDPRAAERLPNLSALRRRSVFFSMARTPGSQTVVTLTSLFLGTYYSQQYWSPYPGLRDLWPDDDPGVRFPARLSEAGVATAHYPTARWLVGRVGVVRGFREERYVPGKKGRYVTSLETFPRIEARLARAGSTPLFVYTHVLDTHVSMSMGVEAKSPRERYWRKLEIVDRSIGRLVETIESLPVADRVILIVSSDHGEAFGEHGVHHHASTLYEELIRVPLLIRIPGVAPRTIDTPVSLIDLGPTILDLFGLPVPGAMMGQSLLPLVAGRADAAPTRPIAAEGHLKKTLVFPDARKAIVDDRHHTREVYDLRADPQELHNLVDAGDPRAPRDAALVERFFEIHRIRRAGYEVPFRR